MTSNSSSRTKTSIAMGRLVLPLIDPKLTAAINERALNAGSKAIEVLGETIIALVTRQFDVVSSTAQRMAEAGKALGSSKGPAELIAMPTELFRSNLEASVRDYSNFIDMSRQYASQMSALFAGLWTNGAPSSEPPRKQPRAEGMKMAADSLSKGTVHGTAE